MGVEMAGIYWHFVDVMWIIVFLTVYILLGGARPCDQSAPIRAGGLPLHPDRGGAGRADRAGGDHLFDSGVALGVAGGLLLGLVFAFVIRRRAEPAEQVTSSARPATAIAVGSWWSRTRRSRVRPCGARSSSVPGQGCRDPRRLPGAQHAAQALGIGRGRGPRRARDRLDEILATLERDGFAAEGDIGDGDPGAGDGGRAAAVPRRRGDHLDASARPLELARAGRGRARPRALRDPGHARRRGPRARGRRLAALLDVSVPFIPACSWPGTLQ